jgi:hypothetical protein
MEFRPFAKIYRLSREVIVTEKIDGTNACVFVGDDGSIRAGSRNGWTEDNFGWALWVEKHKDELRALGPGFHYGEWWGAGIQRRYGLTEKRFSLFNVSRWADPSTRPACCGVVPELWRGNFDALETIPILDKLADGGSVAAPGFMRPEGIVIYHVAGNILLKKTLEKDEEPKGNRQ